VTGQEESRTGRRVTAAWSRATGQSIEHVKSSREHWAQGSRPISASLALIWAQLACGIAHTRMGARKRR